MINPNFHVRYNYSVHFTEDMFDTSNSTLKRVLKKNKNHTKVIVFIDKGVSDCWIDISQDIVKYINHMDKGYKLVSLPILIPGGEDSKKIEVLQEKVYKSLLLNKIDRHSYVICIGGGAVLDAVGFGVATFHRGVRLIRIPTTILAQNDAGIGVKNGINAFGVKNLLGVFAPPHAVINDFLFLETLSSRDKVSGVAEAVKVACIRDRSFFSWLENNYQELSNSKSKVTQHMIERCAINHIEHIANSGDPFEFGNSRPLDFGHWSAHKLESMSNYKIRHGEAVAIGLAIDCQYSYEIGVLAFKEKNRVLDLLIGLGFRFNYDFIRNQSKGGKYILIEGLEEFRQHLGGRLTLMFLEKVGLGFELHEVDEKIMTSSIDKIINYTHEKE